MKFNWDKVYFSYIWVSLLLFVTPALIIFLNKSLFSNYEISNRVIYSLVLIIVSSIILFLFNEKLSAKEKTKFFLLYFFATGLCSLAINFQDFTGALATSVLASYYVSAIDIYSKLTKKEEKIKKKEKDESYFFPKVT